MKRAASLLLFLVACGGGPSAAATTDAVDPAAPEVAASPQSTSATSHGDGVSCDEAMDQNEDRMGQAQASAEAEAEVKKLLNAGAYLNRCQVASSSSVEICAAIMDGEVLGVTVELDPGTSSQADCVAGEVRMMKVPQSPALIRASTQFEPSL